MTRFGRLAGSPAARRRARQRHISAIPPSMHASLDPVVEQPTASACGAFHRFPRMFTHRCSSSAVCGYSSLSIMFLEAHSAISSSASGSIHVVTNVARLSLALPSRMSSSRTTCSAVRGSTPCSGSWYRGISQLFSRKYSGLMSSSVPDSSSGTRLCKAMRASLVVPRSPCAHRGTADRPARGGAGWVSSPALVLGVTSTASAPRGRPDGSRRGATRTGPSPR